MYYPIARASRSRRTSRPPRRPAVAANNNLRQTLHQLRTAFAAHDLTSPVVTGGDDAVVLAPHVTLDIDLFRTEAQAALRRRGDIALYEAALALYGGDISLEDWHDARTAAVREELADLRVRLLIGLAQAEMARGHDASAVAHLQQVLMVDPAHEDAHRTLMRLYARGGQRDRALRQYARCEAAVREEFDVAPSEETRELHQEIRDGRLRVPAGDSARGGTGAFVGRDRELETLRGMLEDSFNGRGGLALLSGDPGIGKSRLVDEFLVYAELRGATVLRGRCYEHDGAPAYWPWEQALGVIHGAAPGVARHAERTRQRPDSGGKSPEPSGTLQRLRLFERIAAALRDASRGCPLVLALDDMHRSDAPALLLLQFLRSELRDARVTIVITFRSNEVGPDLRAALVELTRDAPAERFELAGLAHTDVCKLVELAGLHAPGVHDLCDRLHQRSEGNPLFLREMLRDVEAAGDASAALPATLREVIQVRLRRVSAECIDLLRTSSVMGRDVDLDLLAEAAGWERSHCIAVLGDATSSGLLALTADARQYRFAHALFVEALYDSVALDARAATHARAADAIERLRSGQLERYVAQIADHCVKAALVGGDVRKAVSWCARAGERDTELLAYEDAMAHYETAVDLSERFDCEPRKRRCELLLALADAANRGGDLQACNVAAAHAAEIAKQLGERELQTRATLLTGPRTPYGQDGTWTPADVERLEDAIATWGDEESELHALLLARYGMSLTTRNRPEDAITSVRDALAMARRLTAAPSPEILHYAHGGLFLDGSLDERLGLARELISSARSLGDPEMESHGCVWLFADLLASGDLKEASRVNEQLIVLAASQRQPFFAWYAAAEGSALETARGHFDEAERLAADATHAARGSLAPGTAEITERGVGRFAVRLLRGDVEGLADWYMTVARAFEAASGSQTIFGMPTLLYAVEGRRQEAADNLTMLLQRGYLSRRDYMWCFGVAALAEASVLIDDHRWVPDIYDALLPYEGQCIVLAEGGAWRGAATHYLGMLAAAMCRWDEAESHFADALAVHERAAAAPPFIARTQHEWAKMLAARGEPADRQRAIALLAPALRTARELGMQPLARRASELECSLAH